MIIDHTLILQRALAEKCTVPSRPSLPIPSGAMEAFREGLEYFQGGDPGAALVAFSRSVMQAPDCAEARIFLGLANALTCNIYPALDELEKATELQPDSFAAHFTLAQLNFKLRIPEKGYAAAREALRCASNSGAACHAHTIAERRADQRAQWNCPALFQQTLVSVRWFKKRMSETVSFAGELATAGFCCCSVVDQRRQA